MILCKLMCQDHIVKAYKTDTDILEHKWRKGMIYVIPFLKSKYSLNMRSIYLCLFLLQILCSGAEIKI